MSSLSNAFLSSKVKWYPLRDGGNRAFSNKFKHSFAEESTLGRVSLPTRRQEPRECHGILETEFLRDTTLPVWDRTLKPYFINAKRKPRRPQAGVITFQRLLTVKGEVATPSKTMAAWEISNKFKHSFTGDSPLATSLAPHKKARTKRMPMSPRD